MSKAEIVKPWKATCELRKEIRERQLTSADFAVDLYKVVNGWPGELPFYCDPVQFFSTTYATQNLRQFCRVVLRRIAKQPGGESIINVAQTFGGGKSHTLTALYYLTTLGKKLPMGETSVGMILNDAQLAQSPQARVAAVSFDKVDWKTGCEAKSPEGDVKRFRMPWNLIAWQLLGQKGLDILDRDETKQDYDTPPSDVLWAKLIHEIELKGSAVLILIDEFLMWAHDAASTDPTGERNDRGAVWYDRLKNFFQRLAQAIESSERSCLVVSLLATDPQKNDEVGKAILSACNNGLNRQASLQSPVEKDDLGELLRRRLFIKYPENPADRKKHILAFWPRMRAIDPIKAKQADAEEHLINSYPFHPDLLDRFFGKWTELNQFQRTRGVLQIFALALRDAEKWDDSPIIGPQVLLAAPGVDGLSEALQKLAEAAKDSEPVKSPQWPTSLRSELPRALTSQQSEAATLNGREIEAACIAAFIFSQPIGEEAELSELRWLLGPTCEMPAVLNNGLIAWSKASWYLEECESTEAGTNVPKIWRLGPKPNLNQLHDSFKKRAIRQARSRFDDIAKNRCTPLYDLGSEEGVKIHKLPNSPTEVEDDGQFRLVLLGSDFASIVGDAPLPRVVEFVRTHSSITDTRTYQNIVLVVIPSITGLHQAEQQIAEWIAWGDIRVSNQFKELDSFQQDLVRRRERDSLKEAQTAVKNAFELVVFVDKDGSIISKKITLGAQTLFATLLQESYLRLFREKIDASAIMPHGQYPVWPESDPSIRVSELYYEFGKQPRLPKLLSMKAVINTIESAVIRGVLAVKCVRLDGSEQWFWRSKIDIEDWWKIAEAWLPAKATLNWLSPNAIAPSALTGLWPEDNSGIKLSVLFSWFDGSHSFEEITQREYPPELRPIPRVDFTVVRKGVSKSIEQGTLWLVYGNDSVFGEAPTAIQLDPDAILYGPPETLRAIDLLPANLPEVWSKDSEPTTRVVSLYGGIKVKYGRPWPEKLFMDGLNAAIGQGFFRRVDGLSSIVSLTNDGNVGLVIKIESPRPNEPGPIVSGRQGSSVAHLNQAEVQEFADNIHELTKTLAGSDPQFEVRVTIKSKADIMIDEANKILQKINPKWSL